MSDALAPLDRLLAAKEIVVCCGSGGVGKTSVAASLALGVARRHDAKVLVLTVDPARRLATALGIPTLGNQAVGIDPGLLGADASWRGQLSAAMLDTKQSWDELVLRHAPDEATAYRILSNRLYHNLTARFVQSHDYIAMERLYELHASGEYDLIVIDTPPTRNAVDFLEAPQRMADFFGGRLLRWLTAPYRVGGGRGARMVNVASRPFYQIADRVLGSRFLEEIAEFFFNFQAMYDGFVVRAQAVEQLLHDRRTTFLVVSTLESVPLREAESFCATLAAGGYPLGALVLNRVLPDYFLDETATATARVLADRADTLADEHASDWGIERVAVQRVLTTVATSFERFGAVAQHEAALQQQLANPPSVLVRVPNRSVDIADASGLAWIADHLFASEAGQ